MLLLAAIAALLSGPLLFELGRLGSRTTAFLDGFAFITIAGLFLFGILPEAMATGGPAAWVFAALGLGFPLVVERLFHDAAHREHRAFLMLGALGLLSHCMLDGLILMSADSAGHGAGGHEAHSPGQEQGLAVVLHNMPKGIALWFLLAPAFGRRAAGAVLLLLIGGTVLGYLIGDSALTLLTGPGVAWFQAFVAGSIFHVVLHGVASHEHRAPALARDGATSSPPRWPERLGLLGGLVFLFAYL
jgi:zinc transporter ZupT